MVMKSLSVEEHVCDLGEQAKLASDYNMRLVCLDASWVLDTPDTWFSVNFCPFCGEPLDEDHQ